MIKQLEFTLLHIITHLYLRYKFYTEMRFLIPIICSVLFVFQSCEKPANPEFKSMKNVRFKVDKLVDGAITMTADCVLHNPNAVGLTVTSLDFDIFANGKKASRITNDIRTEVNAKSDFTVPLSFDIPIETLKSLKPKNPLELLKKKEIKVLADGKLFVDVAGVEIKVPVNYEDVYEVKLSDLFNL